MTTSEIPLHPTSAELEGLVFGTLPPDEADLVADHLQECPACEETVRSLEARSDTYLDGLRCEPASPEFVGEEGCAEFVALVAGIGGELASRDGARATGGDVLEFGQLGQYRLLEKLGDGGMGAVYKALHVKLKRVVALKVLPENRLRDAAAIARFEREMEAAGQLQHLNIVAATDAGDHQGTHFLVMEYIAGCDAAQVVDRCGRLSVADACEIVRQAALGLACAHRSGLVHRDVKPSNLMLTPEGTVKVLDLGLALLAAPQSPGELTSTGQVMGTIDYMAPEQVADAHRVDARADIYALGATLYKLLAGVPVYHGPRFQTILQKLRALADEPAPNILIARPDLPPQLAEIVHQLLNLQPDRRPQKAESVAGLLAPYAVGANLSSLLARAESSTAVKGDGSSVHSHLDGTLPASPPVRVPSAVVEAKLLGANAAPPQPLRSRSRTLPTAIVIGALAAMVSLPLMCAGLFFAARLFAPAAPLRTMPSWPSQGRTANDPLTVVNSSLTSMGLAIGDVRYFQTTGRTDGWVWGTDVYTADSSLAAAAVHAGVLKAGETGIVKVTILAGQTSHTGSTRNGVISSNYGSWPQSMRLESGEDDVTNPIEIHEYLGSFYAYRPEAGQVLRFRIEGVDVGSIWGTDVYTTDSYLSVAAVHAGVLKPKESGVVRVIFLPGLNSYTGSTRNGVTSLSWGAYSLSYRVERDNRPNSPARSD